MEDRIKVYVKVNENNEIIEVGSNIFIKDISGWIQIDEGSGDRYAHAQSQYFKDHLTDDNGNYRYKLENNKILEA